MGQYAAFFMGVVVGSINSLDHDIATAIIAGIKQWIASAITAEILISNQPKIHQFCQKFNTKVSHVISVETPALFTTLAAWGVHNIKGTPEIMKSTLTVSLLAHVGYTILHVRNVISDKNSTEVDISR